MAKGETFIRCKRNKPVAEIRLITSRVATKRPIGLAKGKFTVPGSFFDELPQETIELFSGMTILTPDTHISRYPVRVEW